MTDGPPRSASLIRAKKEGWRLGMDEVRLRSMSALSPWVVVYFIPLILLGAFFVINLFLFLLFFFLFLLETAAAAAAAAAAAPGDSVAGAAGEGAR